MGVVGILMTLASDITEKDPIDAVVCLTSSHIGSAATLLPPHAAFIAAGIPVAS